MKKMFLIVILFLSFVIPFKVDAAELKMTFDGDLKRCADANDFLFPSFNNDGKMDGHLLLYSYVNENESHLGLIKLNSNNKIVFDKKADEYAANDIDIKEVDSTTDSEYNDFLITRYDSSNNVLFKYTYSGNGSKEIVAYFKSFDDTGVHDGYLITLFTSSTNLGVDPGFVMIKLNLEGKLLWQKNVSSYFSSLMQLPYVIDGKLDSILGYDDVGVFRINYETGEKIWTKETGFDMFSANYSYNKSNEVDGIIVIGADGDIAKYDLNGNEIFKKNLGSGYKIFDVISSRLPYNTYDGYLVTAVQNGTKMFLLKFDFSGNLIWQDEYKNNPTTAFRIYENYDNLGNFNGYLLQRIVVNVGDEPISDYVCDNKYFVVKYTYQSYPVEKEATDEGSITVNDKAFPGELVKVSVVTKEGYVLKRIVVKDEAGKEIEVSKDGTFVMPEGKVTVTAIYSRITNPETVSACYVVLGIILLISIGTLIVQKKKEIV